MIADLVADRIGARNAGLAFLGAAAVIALVAVTVGWGAVQRWRAASALGEWRAAALAGLHDDARTAAAHAAALAPSSAAAGLAATDLAASDAGDRLALIAVRCAARDRPLVEEAAALAQALRGKAATADGIDGALLGVISALSTDDASPSAAAWPTGDDAPDGAIARAAAERLARAAWRGGDPATIRAAFGRLLLLAPHRRDAKRIALTCAALDPGYPANRLSAFTNGLGTSAELAATVRACQRLAPDRAAAMDPLIPNDQRSPDEARAALLRSGEPLTTLAAKAEGQNDPAVREAVAWRCVGAGELDLALRLSARLPDEPKKRLGIAVASARGDVATLAQLQPDRADLKPRTTEPYAGDGAITFHLATASGLVPSASPTVVLGGQPVPSPNIRRWDSLVMVAHAAGMEQACEIRVGDIVVWTGRVGP